MSTLRPLKISTPKNRDPKIQQRRITTKMEGILKRVDGLLASDISGMEKDEWSVFQNFAEKLQAILDARKNEEEKSNTVTA